MHEYHEKALVKPQVKGLIAGTGLVAAVQLAGWLAHGRLSFYDFVITLYFLTGLFSGYLSPKLSWQWGIWLTVPWLIFIFSNIASTGFKDGLAGSLGWLLLYSFPLLPACAGAFAGAKVAWLREKLAARVKDS